VSRWNGKVSKKERKQNEKVGRERKKIRMENEKNETEEEYLLFPCQVAVVLV